ncbi:MAG: cysteine--tRNA ligase, partial [Clostridia bacterium]|nr:cysteine--tRNA ligase [Clostridia bacterium]
TALERMYAARDNLVHMQSNLPAGEAGEKILEIAKNAREKFVAAMDDDFNTADAVGVIFELVRLVNTEVNDSATAGDAAAALEVLMELCGVMGLLTRAAEIDDPEALALLEQRKEARAAKNWAESDRIRDLLKDMGYVVEDTKQGQKLRRA